MSKKKTLKREIATALMLWLMSLSTWYAVVGGPPQAWQIIDLFSMPISVIFTSAFGLDWITKQTNMLGPPAGDDRPNMPPPPPHP